MAIRYNSGAAREATGLKQMPIRVRTHKTGAGGMSASLIGHSKSSAFDYPPNLTPLMSITNLILPSLSWVMSTSSWNCRLG